MHDPLVVAFEIPRPWPTLSKHTTEKVRWQARYSWATWKQPWKGWRKFWVVAGVQVYWPALIRVWHREPEGRDALTVCQTRTKQLDGTWKFSRGWHWHIHHWKVQIPPLQDLRRRLLTKCEECGRKGRPNVSHQWDREPGRWWQGERGLYHSECSSLVSFRRMRDQDEALIRALVAEIRVRSDESMDETVERLTGHRNATLEFHLRYRLQKVLERQEKVS